MRGPSWIPGTPTPNALVASAHGQFGPTELTLVITLTTVVTLFWPAAVLTVAGLGLRWFDLIALALVLAGAVEFVRSMRLLVSQLPGPSL